MRFGFAGISTSPFEVFTTLVSALSADSLLLEQPVSIDSDNIATNINAIDLIFFIFSLRDVCINNDYQFDKHIIS